MLIMLVSMLNTLSYSRPNGDGVESHFHLLIYFILLLHLLMLMQLILFGGIFLYGVFSKLAC